MNPIVFGAIFATILAAGIIVLLEVGRRIGARRLAEEGETAAKLAVSASSTRSRK